MNKTELRKIFSAARRALSPARREAADRAIRARITALPEFRACRALALFATDGVEPDLLPLMRKSEKILLFPRYREAEKIYEFAVVGGASDLTPGKYGILEPLPSCPAADPELVRQETLHLVPGVAFDLRGVRLGRGGGFYDRLLTGVIGPICGVYYVCQCSPEALAAEPHDRALDMTVTEEFTIRWTDRGA